MAGLRAPHPDMRDRYMWGAAPHPDREPLYMGLRPMPHSRTFLGKVPETRKNRTGKGIIYQMEIVNKAAVGSLVICLAENDFIVSPPKFRN